MSEVLNLVECCLQDSGLVLPAEIAEYFFFLIYLFTINLFIYRRCLALRVMHDGWEADLRLFILAHLL